MVGWETTMFMFPCSKRGFEEEECERNAVVPMFKELGPCVNHMYVQGLGSVGLRTDLVVHY